MKGFECFMTVDQQEDGSFFIKKSLRDNSLAVFEDMSDAQRQARLNADGSEVREGFILSKERFFKYSQQIADLEVDRNNAINQMSKSWKHASDSESDILTRYVTMAENQFEVKNQRIADLERQLKAEREINDRLRVVETERATRNDELYEVLGELIETSEMNERQLSNVLLETHSESRALVEAKEVYSKSEGDYDDSH